MNQTLFRSLLVYLFAFTSLPGFTQQTSQKFGHISVEQGLPQSLINCIFQDSRGFIWIGTQQGLFKYDGYSFISYLPEESNPKSISGNNIRCIYEDSKENLWIGTEGNGLNRFDRKSETFKTYRNQPGNTQSLLNNSVIAITEDKQGKLWIGTSSGLQVFNKDHFQTVHLSAAQQQHPVNYLLEDKAQNLWVGTAQGLFRLDKNRHNPELFVHQQGNAASISSNEVHCIVEAKNGILFIGTHSGMNRFNTRTRTFEKYSGSSSKTKLIAESEIYALALDKEENIWMGTFGNGLIKLNLTNNETTVYTHSAEEKESVSSDVILSLLIDRSGLLWAGTYEGVLDKLNPLRINFGKLTQQPGDTNTLSSNEVYAILEDKQKKLWIGTDNGLSLYGQQSHAYTHFQHKADDAASISNNIVYAILQDSQENVWIGTADGGLNKLRASDIKNGIFRFERFATMPAGKKLLPSYTILTLFEDKSGNIWVGTSGGLSMIDKKKRIQSYKHTPKKARSISHNEILSIFQDKSGVMWVGTSHGLNRFNAEKQDFTRFVNQKNNEKSLPNNTIYSMYENADGYLWLGTDGGLCRLNPERNSFTSYTVKDGLPNNVVYSILEDKSKNLWISTNKGLSKVKKNENAAKPSFVNYNTGNWLHCNSFNIGAYHQTKSGILFFGCNEGITFFDPAAISDNNYVPPVAITDFQLFFEPVKISNGKQTPLSKAITETKKLVLKYNQNVLYFEFAALNYINNEKNEYAFLMEGFDNDWNYVKQKRNATYTNLDPGTYIFRVKASNNDGAWNEQGTSIQITIQPPFYRQPWFYVLCVAGLILGATKYMRYQMREMQKNERILVQKVRERTEEVTRQKEELETTLENLKTTQAQLVQAEKMASLGILTAGVAHEINNPINFVSANVDPLKRDIEDMLQIVASYEAVIAQYTLQDKFKEVEALKNDLDYHLLIGEINDLLKGIKEGAIRTSEIVKGLRNFSRLAENEMKPVNVNEGIDSTLMVLSNQLKNNKVNVFKKLGKVDELLGYPGKLNQVFMNIISNAYQAIGENGEIIIKTFMDKGNVVISIADNGRGIKDEIKNRIFEPFFTTKKVGAGTGLGLSISYGIIKDHNGTISVESQFGKGATFIISIPTVKAISR